MSDLLLVLIVVATALNGIAAGASLDQSIKQLPARHRIGAVAYATYSQAGDLGNGLFWYAGLGTCAVLVSLAATVVAVVERASAQHALPIFLVSGLWALHMLITLTLAAPTLRSQRHAEASEVALAAVFNRFERIQTLRVLLDVLIFGITLWALLSYGC
ncbi:hypothetical protein SE17_03865 [Kouleothrix aurantiaca]|jgi:hypothetical protein|uniref:DUF1772 domain-containing protein n=1 Tax=Kouleothrix aurantiaca TaxID=186479 RepID=A0A0P9D9M6_9CHLR|nr:hypothetical protein SE17_03865 [Kouleothrix aurantiaca]